MKECDGSRRQHDRRWVLRVLAGGVGAFLLEPSGSWPTVGHAATNDDRILPAIPRSPRPATLSPALFRGKTAQAYRIAMEVPELVERMPCYCGCFKSHDHRNNLDCYVDRHAVG